MRFIRKGGRIIPIRDKEKTLLKIDAGTGVVAGALQRGLYKNPKTKIVAGLGLSAISLGTTISRIRDSKSVGEFVVRDTGGFLAKLAGVQAGFRGTGVALKHSIGSLQKIKAMKSVKAKDFSDSFIKKAKTPLIGKANTFNTSYKKI